MALGAREGQVLAMVLREGAWMAGLGVLVGGLASVILARFLRGLLFDVGPGDARIHSAVALLFVFVALFAAWLPARRATRPPGGRPPQRMSRSWTVTIVRSER
ncbi:MAG: FtsX-like permease family protein [Longimicrobiales bacterium]